VLETGNKRFRFVATPHFPHGWDAGHLFEETDRTLFCSDLFHQMGDVEPLTEEDLVGRYQQTLEGMEASPMSGYVPYGKHVCAAVERLAALEPRALLAMHGSSFRGDGEKMLREMETMLAETLG
jgi:flavorubredoxin